MKIDVLITCLASLRVALAATASEWKSRSIYQVMTDRYGLANASTTAWCDPGFGKYCGGSWQGIINNLDYIQNMGFTAIWISPITANLPQYTSDLGSYHGYWQQNMYELNTNFGDDAHLQALSKALHDRGMYLMVDIVVNHFAWAGDHQSVQYDRLIPFNEASYYHNYCDVKGYDASTTECWAGDDVVTLPDLRTEDDNVRQMFKTWISTLITKYNIDGMRLDSAGNVEREFFPVFLNASGAVFATGEIYSGVPAYTCPYQTVLDSVLNYPVYFPLVRAFANSSGSMYDLIEQIETVSSECKDPTLMGSFSENHDQPRFASYTSDLSRAKTILAYTFLTDGIPIVYQGQEQHLKGAHNPLNREAMWLTNYSTSAPLYLFTTALNLFRQHAVSVNSSYLDYKNHVIYNETTTIAMKKGFNGHQVITVLTNKGQDMSNQTFALPSSATGFGSNMVVTNIIGCQNTTTASDGSLQVVLSAGLPNVYYPASLLQDSSICVNGEIKNLAPVALNPPPEKDAAVKAGGSAWALLAVLIVGMCLY